MANRFAFAAAAAVLLLQSGAAHAAAGPEEVMRGRRLAERNCIQCHAVGARGDSPVAAAPRFREIFRRYPAGSLQEAFERGLLTRHPSMPQIRLMPGEIVDLVAYIKSLQVRSSARAGSPVQGPSRS